MIALIGLFFFIVTLLLYVFKPEYIMIFWLISTPILIPLILAFTGISNLDGTHQVIYSVWGYFNRAFLLIILISLIKKTNGLKLYRRVIAPLSLLIIYFLFHIIRTHFVFGTFVENVISSVYALSPFLVLASDKRCWPKVNFLFYCIVIIYVLQVVWMPLNLQGIYAYAARPEIFIDNPQEALLMPGGFLQSNHLADFVSITFLFLCVDFFGRNSLPKYAFLLLSTTALVLLVFGGSKTPIVVYFVTLVGSIFVYQKRNRIKVFVAGVMVFLAGFGFSKLPEINTGNDGFNRVVNELSEVMRVRGNKGEDTSTLRLSSLLIDRYFYRAPLLGNGLAYKGENAYPINDPVSNISEISEYKADARLAYTLIEYGLIGVILMLYYFYSIIDIARRDSGLRKDASLIVFVFFFLFSITETGFFNNANFVYIAMYFYAIKRKRIETLYK